MRKLYIIVSILAIILLGCWRTQFYDYEVVEKYNNLLQGYIGFIFADLGVRKYQSALSIFYIMPLWSENASFKENLSKKECQFLEKSLYWEERAQGKETVGIRKRFNEGCQY